MANQPINGNATIENIAAGDWQQIKCADKPKGEPDNLYRNSQLLGGSIIAAPDNHGLLFAETDIAPVDFADNKYSFEFNSAETLSRSVFGYDLAANNATLEVGARYRFEIDVFKVNAGNYAAAAATSNFTGLTVVASDVVAREGVTERIFIEFTVDSAGFAGVLRWGCGTTAQNTAHLIYRNPSLKKLPAPSIGDYSFDYNEDYS